MAGVKQTYRSKKLSHRYPYPLLSRQIDSLVSVVLPVFVSGGNFRGVLPINQWYLLERWGNHANTLNALA